MTTTVAIFASLQDSVPFALTRARIIPGVDVSLGNVWSRPGRFGGDIVTRLMPGHKTVNVLYTLDGWKTVHSGQRAPLPLLVLRRARKLRSLAV
jgi:hypothetical protein